MSPKIITKLPERVVYYHSADPCVVTPDSQMLYEEGLSLHHMLAPTKGEPQAPESDLTLNPKP